MNLPKTVLILGSGGLRIGQAGEFDYSGSQAIKALKEEGIRSILINPNIATVQTDASMADVVYFQPLNLETVERIIIKERPDAIFLGFGGQTALNLGLALHDAGILKKHRVAVMGTPVSSIKTTEDRELFKQALDQIAVKTARSQAVYSVKEAVAAAKSIGYPIMMRSGYSLGGLGSGRVDDERQLKVKVAEALQAVPQVLIEEYLFGWKEVEYEVVRDQVGNVITVCNMENLDPMGIHTGESIVVAPSQTLTNEEYHSLREVATRTISHLGIVGECNIQYALHPSSGDYRVIEVNARLSRSSALASKATGYPLAFVATKLMLGYPLTAVKNSVTGTTTAFFEPALDYLAVKIPRWDLAKLKHSDHAIGSEMKSVGEVMGLGRSFPEALQKAVRMLNIGADGLTKHPYSFKKPMDEVSQATDRRLFALYEALKKGRTVKQLHEASQIDPWFLHHLSNMVRLEKRLASERLSGELLRDAKKQGFSDATIAQLTGKTPHFIRKQRLAKGIRPVTKQIDTLAGEVAAQTNYLYMTYHGTVDDVTPLAKPPVMVLGSGPYCIGSSVEFDWCAVTMATTLRNHKVPCVVVNSNPETVSTDFDRSDRLYFEELTLERVMDIADAESTRGIVVSTGGQIANNLAIPLAANKYPILGTTAADIDRAEDRAKFSSLLGQIGVDQPAWQAATSLAAAKRFAKLVGYPVLIRPSYVLSGGAMNVVTDEVELEAYLSAATRLSPDHPVVISQFITDAKELEIDGVAKNGEIQIYAISEHIENAGVHSGDATVVLPPQRLYLETVRRAKHIARQVAKGLNISGPFNIQFIAKDNDLKVIECNVRASRSFPFVSKVIGVNFIEIAAEIFLDTYKPKRYQTVDLDHVGIKSPQFSYNRLKGADPVAGVEMASTGEVATLGQDLLSTFLTSWQATEQHLRGRRLFLSVADDHKHKFVDEVRNLQAAGWDVTTTTGTRDYLAKHAIKTKHLAKLSSRGGNNLEQALLGGKFDLLVNIPTPLKKSVDGFKIRRLAIDNHLPIISNAEVAVILLRSLASQEYIAAQPPKAWHEFHAANQT